jgi:transcriptional regulator with XRE-family HTH domain
MPTFAVSLRFNCDSERRALGLLIQLFRESKQLTRSQLESLAKLPERSIKDIEKGIRGVDALELKRLATILGSTVDTFIPCQILKNGQQNNTGDGLARSARKS